MSNVFGSCLDKHTLWTSEVVDGITTVTFTSNVEGQEDVSICFGLKGAVLIDAEGNETPIEAVDGVLQLPADTVGTGVLSADGETYTITFPGEAPQALCVNPVKSVNGEAPDADGNVVLPSSSTVEGDVFNTITTEDGIATEVCLDPVKDVLDANGDSLVVDGVAALPAETISPLVDNGDNTFTYTDETGVPVTVGSGSVVDNGDGTATITDAAGVECVVVKGPIVRSTTVDNGDGTHTVTTADGVETIVCLNPIKTINDIAPDTAGNIAIQELFSTTVDNGDNTFTTSNPDGTAVTWTGDTFAAGASNGDGTATLTLADGTSLTLCEAPCPALVDNGDGTATLTVGAVTIDICLDPVKDVLDADGNSVVVDGVATLPAAATSAITSNDDGTATHDDGNGNTFALQEPIVDGGSGLVGADGKTLSPLKEHVTDRVIDVAADQFVTAASIVPAFTDGVSNAEDPLCRTEIVCGTDGKLYGPAPYRCYSEDGSMVLGGLYESNATNRFNLGEVTAYTTDLQQEFTWTNPDPCRCVMVTASHVLDRVTVNFRGDTHGMVRTQANMRCNGVLTAASFHTHMWDNEGSGENSNFEFHGHPLGACSTKLQPGESVTYRLDVLYQSPADSITAPAGTATAWLDDAFSIWWWNIEAHACDE